MSPYTLSRLVLLSLPLVAIACKDKPKNTPALAEKVAPKKPAMPTLLGCELAKACMPALIAAGTPLKNHGENMKFSVERDDDTSCNQDVFTVTRAIDSLGAGMSLPQACRTDSQALFEAVGKPFDLCQELKKCGQALQKTGSAADAASLAIEVADKAIAKGTYAGETICSKASDALAGDVPYEVWDKACGLSAMAHEQEQQGAAEQAP